MDSRDVELIRQAVYVFSQSICALAEIEGMKAANMQRQATGDSMAYNDADFVKVLERYEVGDNSVTARLFHN